MHDSTDAFGTVRWLEVDGKRVGRYFSLPALEGQGIGQISRLPICLRLVLESVLRNCHRPEVTERHISSLANWKPCQSRNVEVPFYVSRVILQDLTGVPLLVDLAAMRSAVSRLGQDPKIIEPEIPVDLIIDHSIQVDYAGTPDALLKNAEIEILRNRERYEFLKWGSQAFKSLRILPPGAGIIHQVNLEFLAQGVMQKDGLIFPDSVVGTDSHTTMINGLGIVGWGVGGIEAEACMLGQPLYFLLPDVIGVYVKGTPPPEVTSTDIALTITQLLRRANVVGKFVEFFGPAVAAMHVFDRAVIANMAPEYGATMGFFPIDDKCVEYLRLTGRDSSLCRLYEAYFRAQGLFGIPEADQIDYTQVIEIDLSQIRPCVAGPRRPQDVVRLNELKSSFRELLSKPVQEGGYGKQEAELQKEVKIESTASTPGQITSPRSQLRHGSIVIAAITSCTNTSNPLLMLTAGLLAKKAVQLGLKRNPLVKASLSPGSRAVTAYLKKAGLQDFLDLLGFHIVGYGCMTCIGNSGPLDPHIESAIQNNDLIAVAVLSGNRNFEARIHQSVKANFLMSPPLVVAFAIAGRIDIDLTEEPIGFTENGTPVFLKDLWPTAEELASVLPHALDPGIYRQQYQDLDRINPRWTEIQAPTGLTYTWNPASTYIQEPPFFDNFKLDPEPITEIRNARLLALFGDSVTTDHISPAGPIRKDSPAGRYLLERGVQPADFNTYGARRGNHEVMIRGTYANVRIRNLILGGEEGGYTIYQPTGEKMTIYEAAMRYKNEGIPLVVIAGKEYGTGSSRDWAAKGTALLGIKAVVAESFERIHRSNLVGMGVLPLELKGRGAVELGIKGDELFDVVGLNDRLRPQQELRLVIKKPSGATLTVPVRCRLDTQIEVEYYRHGGILPYVLRQILRQKTR